jgi:dihydroorotate dehydrogenase (NAD+) catalytic subunit
VTRISDVGRACLDAGADGLSAINTLLGMRIDPRTRQPYLSRGVGGLSGPAIRPVALAKCFELVRTLDCDVIGIGGIAGVDDTLEFLLAGCKAVQVGTVVYTDPRIPARIAEGLAAHLRERGEPDLSTVIGGLRVDEDLLLGPGARPQETSRGS